MTTPTDDCPEGSHALKAQLRMFGHLLGVRGVRDRLVTLLSQIPLEESHLLWG